MSPARLLLFLQTKKKPKKTKLTKSKYIIPCNTAPINNSKEVIGSNPMTKKSRNRYLMSKILRRRQAVALN